MKNGAVTNLVTAPGKPQRQRAAGGPLVEQTNGLSPRLLSYKAASSYLSISYWSVRTLVVNGEVPHVKFGKRILLDRLALDEWVEKNLEVGV